MMRIVRACRQIPENDQTLVLSHNIPESVAKGAETFTFITDGIESALQQAQAAAGDREVVIAGGASTAQQLLKAGLIDKIQIHLVPELLGQGIRLFDHIGKPLELERTNVIDAPNVTHIMVRVVR